jgi:aldehyde dehydrogenase (NAD+)
MAELVARELRASFAAGRTRPLEWRAAQLRALVRMIEEKEDDIGAAVHADLAKPHLESYLHEVQLLPTVCPLLPYTRLVPIALRFLVP